MLLFFNDHFQCIGDSNGRDSNGRDSNGREGQKLKTKKSSFKLSWLVDQAKMYSWTIFLLESIL